MTEVVFALYLLPAGSPGRYAVVAWNCAPDTDATRGEPVYVDETTDAPARASIPATHIWHEAEQGDARGLIGTWQPPEESKEDAHADPVAAT